MRISCHLSFDGRCEEAFRFYQGVLGGNLTTLLKYGDSPLAAQTPKQFHGRLIHATLSIDAVELFGADMLPPDFRPHGGFFVVLGFPGIERACSVFEALAAGGTVQLPFQKTFWSAGFGVVVDRFGVPWEIGCDQPADDDRPALNP